VRIAGEAREAAKAFITDKFGQEYYPAKPRIFKSKSSAQDAHEAIRPVDVNITPKDVQGMLPPDQFRLYKLIWERFTASQMAAARFWDTTVAVEAQNTLWRAKGERLLFPGFLKVYRQEKEKGAKELPSLSKGQSLSLESFNKEQKFTQPPPRYSEASLVKELEEKGIGRPSTYASIISTLLDRDYVRLTEKRLAPTDLGTTVGNLLVEHFTNLMDVSFTAQMEKALDKVAVGQQDWVSLLKDFTGRFYPVLDQAMENMVQVKSGLETDIRCEECGRPMVIKFGRAGTFLACAGYPKCRNTKNFTRNEKGAIEIIEKPKPQVEKTGKTCPECGQDLVVKRSRTGSRFIACMGYPGCKHAEPFSTGVKCPKEGCKGMLVEKSSRRGKIFYSCDQYPKCDYALWNWPVPGPCPECGFPILARKETKAKGEHLACPQKSCKYTNLKK